MRLHALAVLVTLVTSCISGSKKPGYITGGVATAIGIGLLASTQQQDCSSMQLEPALSCASSEVGAATIGTSALIAGLAIITLTAVIPAPDAEPTIAEPTIDGAVLAEVQNLPIVEPSTSDPMLRHLTLHASVAARAGRCLTVEVIAHRIGDIDPGYRDTGFIADPLVAACLK